MNMHLSKVISASVVTLLGILVISGCGTNSNVGQNSQNDQNTTGKTNQTTSNGTGTNASDNTVVRVIWQPSGETGYYYATKENLFKKMGISISSVKINTGAEELNALAGGSADIAFMGGPPGITALAKGINIDLFYVGNNNATLEGLVAAPGSGISNIQQIKGKTIAVPKLSTADIGIHLAMKKAGIPFNSVHILYMDPAQMVAAFQNHQIDGAWVWDSWTSVLVQNGGKRITTESQYGVADGGFWWVRDSFLKAHPDLVAKFAAVLNAGAEGSIKDPQAVVSQYASLIGVNQTQALYIMQHQPAVTTDELLSSTYPLSFTNTSSGIVSQLNTASQMLVSLGDLQQAPPNLEQHIALNSLKQSKNYTVN